MREGIIYDCPNANCKTPIYTGKCNKACIEKYNKEMGKKPQTNADRIRAMSDEELAKCMEQPPICKEKAKNECMTGEYRCGECLLEWLKQPAEE